MGMLLAFKAFFKALRDKEGAQKFLSDERTAAPKPRSDLSHLRLLSFLQHSGRFIDFMQEDISSFTDAQVGAAVRKIHEECKKCLEELVTVRPVMEEGEGARVRVPKGYDPQHIKVVGKVKGEPPFEGVLVHRGWKAHKHSLPKQVGESQPEVLCPAEVEIR